ncbi:MAG: RNA-binding S4 domain-containing protein [Pelagimonas sp.]|uniref:RNA-binding S4 domain-containing protein n=1 Tax=Pelagimonas sp. TaxID=2073170 RepID=UPI003D6C4FF1
MAETTGKVRVEKIRIDKWLWQARFFKTRSLSAKVVSAGGCRVNGTPVSKPAFGVSAGDVLTFAKEDDVRVIKVVALGDRRGPAPEARQLYEDLAPPQPREKPHEAPKFDGGGRPSKRDRRALEQLRRDVLE